MSQSCIELFEHELEKKGIAFAREADTGRHVIERPDGMRLLVSLDNLSREFERDRDSGRISRFIDTLLTAGNSPKSWVDAQMKLFLALEPRHFAEPPDVTRAVSDHVDRVPVLFDPDLGAITWVSRPMLQDWAVAEDTVFQRGAENLDTELRTSTLEYREIDGMRLAFISSHLPFKASLILAPSFRQFAERIVGWPLLAAAPARDFLYLWNARHRELIDRMGPTVVEEFESSPYPLSAEVFELTDEGLQAIGEFATRS